MERVKSYLSDLDLPLTLAELGITDPDLPAMAEEASRMVLLPNNPRTRRRGRLERVLEGIE